MVNCKYSDICTSVKNGLCPRIADPSSCEKAIKFEMALSKSLLTERQQHPVPLRLDAPDSNGYSADANEFDELHKISQGIIKFANRGYNLCLFSTHCGNGKTSWAIKLMLSYISKVSFDLPVDKCSVIFIHVPTYFNKLKNSFNGDAEQRYEMGQINQYINEAKLVVWDEIGVKASSEWESEQLLVLINSRLDQKKSNIYTANLFTQCVNGKFVPESLESKLGPRLNSRIIGTSKVIELHGKDKRELSRGF